MELKVGTFNIAGGNQPDTAAIHRLLIGENIAVAGLQEVDRNTKRAPFDMAEAVAGSDYAVQYAAAMPLMNGEYGIAIVANGPLSQPRFGHYATTGLEPRAWQRCVYAAGERRIAVYNTHLAFETPAIRKAQVHALLAEMAQDPLPDRVLCGDFNMDQSFTEWQDLEHAGTLVNGPDEWLDTFIGRDETMKTFAIDNILLQGDLHLVERHVVKTILSDHRMLVATIAL